MGICVKNINTGFKKLSTLMAKLIFQLNFVTYLQDCINNNKEQNFYLKLLYIKKSYI